MCFTLNLVVFFVSKSCTCWKWEKKVDFVLKRDRKYIQKQKNTAKAKENENTLNWCWFGLVWWYWYEILEFAPLRSQF
jgi:hypothetical protein